MAANLLKSSGFNLLTEYNGALERLAETTLKGFENPEIFAAKTTVKQEFNLNDSTAWVPIYLELNPKSSVAKNALTKTPSNWNRALGGRPIELLKSSAGRSFRCDGLFN